MAKTIFILICIATLTFQSSAFTNIDCNYDTSRFWSSPTVAYWCFVNYNPDIITQESATISSISGEHKIGKSNSDVEGFSAYGKAIKYFPRNLENFFKNIKAITIWYSDLKYIHREDLKPFPNLIELHLKYNLIEVLEDGLFEFNSDLEFISISYNFITHIEPNVFDNLNKLNTLLLNSNPCIDQKAENSNSDVQNVIQAAKAQCVNFDVTLVENRFRNFNKDSLKVNE